MGVYVYVMVSFFFFRGYSTVCGCGRRKFLRGGLSNEVSRCCFNCDREKFGNIIV